MQLLCQFLVLAWLVCNFLAVTEICFNGRPAREPNGFEGFLATCAIMGVLASIYWGAGALPF